jgi:anti-sigma regulatory factor (Ser/Thr protein kinase)
VNASLQQAAANRATSELWLAAQPSQLVRAREFAHEAATAAGFDADGCYDFTFAANEAVTNAIRHGRPDEHGRIHLSVLADGQCLTLSVRDYGTFVMPIAVATGDTVATLSADSGRGFTLMGAMMDAVELCVSSAGTTVRLTKGRV